MTQSRDNSLPCSVCPLAKQKHLSFNSSNKSSGSCFDLIHCDIWGLFTPCTVEGYKYFLTIVDDYTSFTWVYLLHAKSDVISVSRILLSHTHNLTFPYD